MFYIFEAWDVEGEKSAGKSVWSEEESSSPSQYS